MTIFFFYSSLVEYGIPFKDNSELVNTPFSFTIVNNGKISRELMIDNESTRTEFVRDFFFRLYVDVFRLHRGKEKELTQYESLKKEIINFSIHHLKKINDIISTCSPIKKIRINPDFNLIIEEASQKQTITNFYIEFLIENDWLTFSLLSDGTKRLFYIISEISNHESVNQPDKHLNIILLEEPELGIHPHQLHQLMQFIKEQSKEKQIIITTHSPQVLDVLEPDELDRIIICHSEPKTGTQLSHLDDQQIKKAKKYMTSEAFLSDYWRFSDLEPA